MQALLILGGEEIFFKDQAKSADVVVCADSGADYSINQGIIPDVVIGDMDSISQSTLSFLKSENTSIISYPVEKDKTDGEIALDYIKDMGVKTVEIVCVEGSIDHYLGNLYLLLYANKLNLNAIIETKDMLVYFVEDEITLEKEKDTRISILPAGSKVEVFKTNGLYYEIDKPLTIKMGQTIGIGNHMTGSQCNIKINKGKAFVIVEK